MTTPNDIINQALKTSGVLGIGQTAAFEDTNDAFFLLNLMISQWNRKRWLVYHLIDVAFTSTGAVSYTVGPGQNFNCPRPDRIESAFFRQQIQSIPNQIDYPLEILESREDYNRIALKQLTSFPNYVWYDSAFPIGFLYPWPVPQANIYEVHISVKETLPQFTSLAQQINLPPEYFACILYNLAARLRPAYQLPPDPTIIGLAKDALSVVRGANTQIGRLTLPIEILRPGIYNVYSDQIR
jgi:hypothetical protein